MKNSTTFIITITLIATALLLTYITSQDSPQDPITTELPAISSTAPGGIPNNSTLTQDSTQIQLAPHNQKNKARKTSVAQVDDLAEKKIQLFKAKNERIIQDDNGNYLVDISTPGLSSREWILSDSPIYFPTEDQLNNGIDGCAAGGYYVELKAILSLVVETENGNTRYQYLCTHNQNSNLYFLESYDVIKPELQNSINKLIIH
jgi:hypothetical protein